MNEKGNKYGLALLKRKRGELAFEVAQANQKIDQLKKSIKSIDKALRILDPSIALDEIPLKRGYKRLKLFKNRAVLDALRESGDTPISAHQIVCQIMKANTYGENRRPAVQTRVRSNLHHLERTGVVRKVGDQKKALWQIA